MLLNSDNLSFHRNFHWQDSDLHVRHYLYVVYWGMVGGVAPVEACTEVQYPCKANGSIPCQFFVSECHLLGKLLICICSFDDQNAPVGNISHWEAFILLFFILGHKELKVEREYRVTMFNGFINAWFDSWYKHYDYADMWKWLKEIKIFLVFCITIFPEKAQNKTTRRPFIKDENT